MQKPFHSTVYYALKHSCFSPSLPSILQSVWGRLSLTQLCKLEENECAWYPVLYLPHSEGKTTTLRTGKQEEKDKRNMEETEENQREDPEGTQNSPGKHVWCSWVKWEEAQMLFNSSTTKMKATGNATYLTLWLTTYKQLKNMTSLMKELPALIT